MRPEPLRLLLTGAHGQVGFELRRALAPLGALCATARGGGEDSVALDLAEPGAARAGLDRWRPQVVVNAAAYTAVDRAESEPVLAQRVNAEAVAELADWCTRNDALLVHFSTDYVFAGEADRPWREDDATGPLGVYGRSKLDGEQALRASGCRNLILRTAWVYAARGHNFLRTMLRLARERERLRVVDDQVGAPTPARWLAAATAALVARLGDAADAPEHALGTFHLTAAGHTSWHGFAAAIFEAAVGNGLLPRAPQLDAIATREYPTPARRPAYSVLDGERLQAVHGLRLPDWRLGLRQTLEELDPC